MPTAIVTGATGILGREIVRALSADASWKRIHAISRSQKEAYGPNVHHDTVDLTGTPEAIATQLKGAKVEGEYLFFTAYLQRDDEKEMERVNGDMLRNFLTALALTGAERRLKRVILTTGAKQYGVHLGPVKLPMEEEDAWIEGEDRPPNFYYRQQRILHAMSRQSKENIPGAGWDWVVTYPNDVIGVAKGNFMNLTTAIGLYAAVTKELNAPFIFPGSPSFYTGLDCFTYSRLHAKFNLWAALKPECGNEAFNVVNGDVQSWQVMWPRLAQRFGLSVPPDQFDIHGEDEKVVPLQERPPLADYADKAGITKSLVPRGEVRMHIDLLAWSQKPEVQKAWETVAERDGLHKDALSQATWFFLNFVLGRNYDLVISMNKARKLGFEGWMDTWEALSVCLDELEDAKILPKTRK